jgi:hypothetical protein
MSARKVQVGLRLEPDMLRVLDAWIARQRRPMSRAEAIRLLLADRLQTES